MKHHLSSNLSMVEEKTIGPMTFSSKKNVPSFLLSHLEHFFSSFYEYKLHQRLSEDILDQISFKSMNTIFGSVVKSSARFFGIRLFFSFDFSFLSLLCLNRNPILNNAARKRERLSFSTAVLISIVGVGM